MIPRKIHYVWLSGDEMPPVMRRCMATWQDVLPDYTLVKWDATNLDFSANAFVAEAIRARKWAFATDFFRIDILHKHGGIYLDTDVSVKKRFDEFLSRDFFTALEYHRDLVKRSNTLDLLHPDGSSLVPNTPKPGIGLQAAILGAVAGHPFLADILAYYRDIHFVQANGEYQDKIIAPDIYAMAAEAYGFRYLDEQQTLSNNMLILPSHIFAGNRSQAASGSHAIHECVGSWRDTRPTLLKTIARALYRKSGIRHLVKKLGAGVQT